MDLLTQAQQRLSSWRSRFGTGPITVEKDDLELVDGLAQQVTDLRNLLEDSKRSNTVMKRAATLREKEVEDLQNTLAAKGGEIQAIEDRMRADVEAVRAELASANEKLESANAGLAESRRQAGDMSEEVGHLRIQLETREAQLSSRRDGEAQLRESWFAIKQERDGLQQKLEEAQRQIESGKGRVNEVIDQRVQELAEAERRYLELEAKLTSVSELAVRAQALADVGHGVVPGETTNVGASGWADAAWEILNELAKMPTQK